MVLFPRQISGLWCGWGFESSCRHVSRLLHLRTTPLAMIRPRKRSTLYLFCIPRRWKTSSQSSRSMTQVQMNFISLRPLRPTTEYLCRWITSPRINERHGVKTKEKSLYSWVGKRWVETSPFTTTGLDPLIPSPAGCYAFRCDRLHHLLKWIRTPARPKPGGLCLAVALLGLLLLLEDEGVSLIGDLGQNR